MQIQTREGIHDVSSAKENATGALRDFQHLRTQFVQEATVEVDNYFSSLIFCMILGWESIKNNPDVQNKLNHFPQRVALDRKLTQISKKIVSQIPSSIIFHNQLINEWRKQFNKEELEAILDLNEDVNVDVGEYEVVQEDQKFKKRIRYERSFGSNCDAQRTVLLVKNISNFNGLVFLIVCCSTDLYNRTKQQYEKFRSSYKSKSRQEREQWAQKSQEIDPEQLIQNDPNDSNSHNEIKEKKRSEVRPIESQNLTHGFSKSSGQYRVIDKTSGLDLQTFLQRGTSIPTILLHIVAILLIVFVSILNYYHYKRDTFSQQTSPPLWNSISSWAYGVVQNIISLIYQ